MELKGKVAVITSGTEGIGLAMAIRFIQGGATVVVSGDNEKTVDGNASEMGATVIVAETTKEKDVRRLVYTATRQFGRIDLFVSNCGVAGFGDPFSSGKESNYSWHINLMSQMYAAKYVLPQMVRRGSGYLLNTVPAAGLFAEHHSVFYSTTKHPSLSFSERLAVTYKKAGIKVSVLCPDAAITPLTVDLVVDGLSKEQFLISSHENISMLYQSKLRDYHKYII